MTASPTARYALRSQDEAAAVLRVLDPAGAGSVGIRRFCRWWLHNRSACFVMEYTDQVRMMINVYLTHVGD